MNETTASKIALKKKRKSREGSGESSQASAPPLSHADETNLGVEADSSQVAPLALYSIPRPFSSSSDRLEPATTAADA